MNPWFDFLQWIHQQKALVCDQMLTEQEPWLQPGFVRPPGQRWSDSEPVMVNYNDLDFEDVSDDEDELTDILEESEPEDDTDERSTASGADDFDMSSDFGFDSDDFDDDSPASGSATVHLLSWLESHIDDIEMTSYLSCESCAGDSDSWDICDMQVSAVASPSSSRKKSKGEVLDSLERTTASLKDFTRKAPKTVIIAARMNGTIVRALLGTGSRTDFISSPVVDLLKLKRIALAKPQSVKLAVTGSHTTVNFGVDAELEYQTIKETRHFDVMNIEGYDVILETPFLSQHRVIFRFNPVKVVCTYGSR